MVALGGWGSYLFVRLGKRHHIKGLYALRKFYHSIWTSAIWSNPATHRSSVTRTTQILQDVDGFGRLWARRCQPIVSVIVRSSSLVQPISNILSKSSTTLAPGSFLIFSISYFTSSTQPSHPHIPPLPYTSQTPHPWPSTQQLVPHIRIINCHPHNTNPTSNIKYRRLPSSLLDGRKSLGPNCNSSFPKSG